jgi:hypothetical protein
MNRGLKVIFLNILVPLAVATLTVVSLFAYPAFVGLPLVIGFILWLLIAPIRRRMFLLKNGWYAGRRGRDLLYYQEVADGVLRELDVGGEMLCGKPSHIVYVPSEHGWNEKQPQWAYGRRTEIIRRMKSLLKEPDYRYEEANS